MLQQIDSKHLAALEAEISSLRASEKECWIKMNAARLDCSALRAELARVTAQRDALRDAALIIRPWAENSIAFAVGDDLESAEKDLALLNRALQACQD